LLLLLLLLLVVVVVVSNKFACVIVAVPYSVELVFNTF